MSAEYDERELAAQEILHAAVREALEHTADLDGRILTGWVVCWETVAADSSESASAGSFYGPRGMTTWRSLGLLEWARRFTLGPGEEEEEEG